MFDVIELRCAGIHCCCVRMREARISESVGVRVVGRRVWEREAECPVKAVLDDVRVGGS